MNTTQKILLFYAPYTTRAESLEYQKKEIMFSFFGSLFFAGISMIPVFSIGYWLIGLLGVACMFIILRTVYANIMHSASCYKNGEEKFIPGSSFRASKEWHVFVSMLIAMVVFAITTKITGWN